MSTSILKSEVQARIDALTYPISTTELLQSAVDTVGLELDLTNIIAVHTSATSTITSATSDDDITSLNAASIALGITSKGGAGASTSTVGTVRAMHTDDVAGLYLTGDEEWLRSGVIETDVASYPDAKQGNYLSDFIAQSGIIDVSNEGITGMSVSWDGTYFNVIDLLGDTVYRYDSAGIYTGSSFLINQDASPIGAVWDGTNYWVAGTNNDRIYKYDANWTNISNFVPSSASTIYGITFDGTNLWILNRTNNRLDEYTTAGVYTGNNIDTSSLGTSMEGCTYHEGNFYVMKSSTIYLIDLEGNIISAFATDSVVNGGGTIKDGSIWYPQHLVDAIKEVSPPAIVHYVGLEEAYLDTSTNLPIYVRIK